MINEKINKIKTRLGSFSDKKKQQIYELSPCAHTLIFVDLIELINEVSNEMKIEKIVISNDK